MQAFEFMRVVCVYTHVCDSKSIFYVWFGLLVIMSIYTCMYMYRFVSLYLYVNMYKHVHMNVCECGILCIYKCGYIFSQMCECAYVYMNAHPCVSPREYDSM